MCTTYRQVNDQVQNINENFALTVGLGMRPRNSSNYGASSSVRRQICWRIYIRHSGRQVALNRSIFVHI